MSCIVTKTSNVHSFNIEQKKMDTMGSRAKLLAFLLFVICCDIQQYPQNNLYIRIECPVDKFTLLINFYCLLRMKSFLKINLFKELILLIHWGTQSPLTQVLVCHSS